VVLRGENAAKPFLAAFDAYWHNDDATGFGKTAPAKWTDLRLTGIDARVGFSPHAPENALLVKIADDIGRQTTSGLLYSLTFLHRTPGLI
jgi:hypothetical protein